MNTNHIDENTINQIRISSDIVKIISDYIPLKKKGRNYIGVCPFHADHSPSMSVSPEKQIYKCFACGAAGNVFKFVMDYENVNYIEAVKIIGDKIGINIDIKNNIKMQKKDSSNLYELYEISQMFYQNNINTKEGKMAREYLLNRKIDNNIIKELNGEKIDVIPYEKDPSKFIENALSPAKNLKVFITDDKKKEAMVIVDNDNLSLAIGKKGINVKLAARLTHFKIDVKTYEQAEEEGINILG